MKALIYLLFLTLPLGTAQEYRGQADSLKNLLKVVSVDKRYDIYEEIARLEQYNNAAESIAMLQEGCDLAGQMLNYRKQIHFLTLLGEVYQGLGLFSKSNDYHRRALSIAGEIKDSSLIGDSHNHIGNNLLFSGQYDTAIEQYYTALLIREKSGNPEGIAATLNNLGISYYRLGNYAKAIDYIKRSLRITADLRDSSNTALRQNNLGLVYLETGDDSLAMSLFTDALQLSRSLNEADKAAYSLGNLAQANFAAGNIELALSQINEAIEEYRGINAVDGITELLIIRGEIYIAMEQFNLAVSDLQQALDLAKQSLSLPRMKDAHQYLIIAYRKSGDYKSALDYYDTYVILKDSLINEKKNIFIANLEMMYNTEKQKQAIERLQNARDKEQLIVNFLIGIIGLVLIGSTILVYFYSAKKRELLIRLDREKDLLGKRQQLGIIVNNLSIILWSADREGNILVVDGWGLREMNFDRNVISSNKIAVVFNNNERFLSAFRRALSGETLSRKIQLGEHFFEFHFSPLINEEDAIHGVTGLAVNYTDQMAAESALKKSEHRFRSIWENSFDGLRLIDEEGTIILVNDAYCKLVGKPKQELEGKPFPVVYEGIDKDAFLERWRSNVSIRYTDTYIEDEMQLWDGRHVWFEASNSIISTFEGGILLLSVFRDITKRKETERLLRENEERWRYLIQNMPYLFTATDEYGMFIAWNNECERVTGYSSEDILESPDPFKILYPDQDYYDHVKSLWQRYNNDYRNLEWDITCKNGSTKTIAWSNISQYVPIPGIFSWTMGIDVTERKIAEDALLMAEKKYRDLFELAPIGVFQITPDGTILSMNPTLFNLMEQSKSGGAAKNNLFHDLQANGSQVDSLIEILESEGEAGDFELEILVGEDEPRWLSLSANKRRDPVLNLWCYDGFTLDITERKKAESDLTIAKDEAENANRAKSIFLANISHEIRTPMNAILGFTDILEAKLDDKQSLQYLQTIASSGKILLRLINDILDLSKIEAGKIELQKETVDPRRIFAEIKETFSWKTDHKKIEFILDIDPSLPAGLLLDEVHLRQILINLVGNAIKFTEKGYVKLSVDCRNPSEADDKIDLFISIEDTGIGIDSSQVETIFEAFQQQSGQNTAKYGGTGLGLAITKRLVELMNGIISVSSDAGKGSVFKVTLYDISVVEVTDTFYKRKRIDIDEVEFEDATVLIVDDISFNRQVIQEFLALYGIASILAVDGDEAVSAAAAGQPNLILMDMKMPGINGNQAAQKIKENPSSADIPIIAFTASLGLNSDKEKIPDYYDGFLRKPVQLETLILELMKFLPHKTEQNELKEEREKTYEQEIFNVDFVKENNKNLPMIINLLEMKWFIEWEIITNTFIINQVGDFADAIEDFARHYGCRNLTAWAEEIKHLVDSFDMEKLPKRLNDFPKILEFLKEQQNTLEA